MKLPDPDIAERPDMPARSRRARVLRRWLPLVLLLVAVALAFALGLDKYLTFDSLKANRNALLDFVAMYPAVAPVAYMAIYAAVIALSLPGGAIMTMTGGFLFGVGFGTAWTAVGATVGATTVFLIARTSIGDSLRRRAGPWMRKMEAGFRENAISYMLVLRLVPLFPFFVVNLVPAFFGVRTAPYVLTTLFGILPATFVYASVGAGLGSVFDSGEEFSLTGVLTPQVIVALVGLAVLALIPVIYEKLRKRMS